ncbi:MAG: hypothetical protein Q8J84_03230 [Flavobacteriaceae bacterium]|nr:hypothetical protein [Flavobacteriaceae bacterium]
MQKLGIVITDGVGYRNFILSDFISASNQTFDEVVIFSCLPKHVYTTLPENFTIIELEVFQEKFPAWFFRKAKELTHLHLNAKDNFGIQDNLKANYSTAKTPRGLVTRLLHKWTAKVHSEKWIQRYNWLQQKTFQSNPITQQYLKLLKEYQLSILFFTHQRPPYIAPLIYAAEQLKIKTATFIFSWDNLASKSRMAGNFDYYLVWSDLMMQELLQFYPSIKAAQIAVVGTPQFEPYVLDRYKISKDELIKTFNLDAQKPILLFTCNDSSSENDPIYLELVAHFIATDKLVKEVNLVVRTSPAEDPTRFKHIAGKFSFIHWNYPDWKLSRTHHQEAWSQRVPSFQDIVHLRGLLNHCDLCINVLSTITLDAFLFDKPVINPIFGNQENQLFNDQKFLSYQHLVTLVDSNATLIVKNEQQLLDAINKQLQEKDTRKIERSNFLKLQIGKPLPGTSLRIAQTLKDWC